MKRHAPESLRRNRLLPAHRAPVAIDAPVPGRAGRVPQTGRHRHQGDPLGPGRGQSCRGGIGRHRDPAPAPGRRADFPAVARAQRPGEKGQNPGPHPRHPPRQAQRSPLRHPHERRGHFRRSNFADVPRRAAEGRDGRTGPCFVHRSFPQAGGKTDGVGPLRVAYSSPQGPGAETRLQQ